GGDLTISSELDRLIESRDAFGGSLPPGRCLRDRWWLPGLAVASAAASASRRIGRVRQPGGVRRRPHVSAVRAPVRQGVRRLRRRLHRAVGLLGMVDRRPATRPAGYGGRRGVPRGGRDYDVAQARTVAPARPRAKIFAGAGALLSTP